MTDTTKIEPALSADEWAKRAFSRETGNGAVSEMVRDADGAESPAYRQFASRNGPTLTTTDSEWGPRAIPALIALANDILPDNDRRKITREMLGDLRLAAGRLVRAGDHLGVDLAGHADALASYLPPEGP